MTMLTDPELYKSNLLEYLEKRTSSLSEAYPFLNIEAIKNISIFERDTFLSDSISDNRHRPFYKIFILGAGGVTSWFLPQLLKIIYNYKIKNNSQRTYEIVLMDGDTVETKNLLRQNFIPEDVGKNKAQVLAERYDDIYENINVKFVPKYFYSAMFYACMDLTTPKEFKSNNFLKDLDFLTSSFNVFFNLVDNELSKHMLDFTLKDTYAFKDSNYFSTGCDLYNGNVFYTNVGVDTYTNYFKDTTFIREDTTIDIHDCATVAETATVEQTFDTNNVAANILAVLFNNFITNPSKFTTKRVNFIATSSPKTEVVDYEHTYQVQNFLKKFRQDTNDLTDYLVSRDFEFKRSKLGKQYKEQLESYSKYVDTDAYIEYLKRIFNYIE